MHAGDRAAPCDDGYVANQRIRFRSPGVKPGQKIGPLGPFRGRLGLPWVIAPMVLGVVLLVVGWVYLRGGEPSPPWRPIGEASALPVGEGRETMPGVFVARLADGRVIGVVQEPGCRLEPGDEGYLDCRGAGYGLDGAPLEDGEPLDLVPVTIHEGVLYVNPQGRIGR